MVGKIMGDMGRRWNLHRVGPLDGVRGGAGDSIRVRSAEFGVRNRTGGRERAVQ